MSVDENALDVVRHWLREQSTRHHQLSYNAFYQALSASYIRISRYGLEAGVDAYSARELLHFTLMCADPRNEQWLRHAFARAVLEDDREVIALFAPLPLVADFQAWFHALDAADEPAAAAALTAPPDTAEELAMRRLVVARRHPRLIDVGWLRADDAPAERIAHALLLVIAARRGDLHEAALAFLAASPRCLVAGEPDDVLAPLVEASPRPPQHVLAPFAGWYGDCTVVAASAWHLEHREPSAALALASTVRALSRHADRAALIAALASLDLDRGADAIAWAERIDDDALRAQAELAVLERDAGPGSAPAALKLALACPRDRPELFSRCLRLLLGRRDLARAREACARRRDEFLGHPVVGAIIDEVLRPRRAEATPPGA